MIDKEKIERAVRMIIEALGEDPDRPGLRETPKRIARMYEEIFSGYNDNEEIIHFEGRSDMVIVQNIRFFSMCEHHILPFYGTVDVVYIPRDNKVIGISKIVRIVQKYAKRLQVQERMTYQIAEEIYNSEYKPKGVLVISRAKHTCMIIRGVRNPSTIVSMVYKGVFDEDRALLNEALLLLSQKPPSLELDLSR